MDIISEGFPKGNDVLVSEFCVKYLQESDTCSQGNGSVPNIITIKTQDGGAGTYYVIRTDRWAFNKPEELVEILNDFIKRAK